MKISSQAAKNMATIIITETQGAEILGKQQPLSVIDQGDRWLVYGTPYEDREIGLNYCQFYVVFLKDSAEIVGLGSEASLKINPSARQYILDAMSGITEEQLSDAFGPRKVEQMDGSDLEENLDFNHFLYGGLINTSEGAVKYASSVMSSLQNPKSSDTPSMFAEERSGVWHISRRQKGANQVAKPFVSFERRTCRVLSLTE